MRCTLTVFEYDKSKKKYFMYIKKRCNLMTFFLNIMTKKKKKKKKKLLLFFFFLKFFLIRKGEEKKIMKIFFSFKNFNTIFNGKLFKNHHGWQKTKYAFFKKKI